MGSSTRSEAQIAEIRSLTDDPPPNQDMSAATFEVFEVPIARFTMDQAITQVMRWATMPPLMTRVVNFANVHMLAESRADAKLKTSMQHADLNLPDGRPISWLGRLLFGSSVTQVAGPDFMPLFCEKTADLQVRHFFYGGGPGVANACAEELRRRHPNLKVAGSICPPFRPLTVEEERKLCDDINRCAPDVIWICLGCPKQELWAARNRTYLNAKVILAVGQAVDILAGTRRRAPVWTQILGLEWLYRFIHEPGRLWKRYLVTNTVFFYWIVIDLSRGRLEE